jgi:hypothetical protein
MLEKYRQEKIFFGSFGFQFSPIFIWTLILTEAWKHWNGNALCTIRRSFHVKILPLSHYRITKTAVISLHTFSAEFAFKTPRAVTRALPPCGGTKNDGSCADTFNTGDATLSSRTGSRSPCHHSHQSWCTGVSIRSGLQTLFSFSWFLRSGVLISYIFLFQEPWMRNVFGQPEH